MEGTSASSAPPRIFCPKKIRLSRERANRILTAKEKAHNPFIQTLEEVEKIIFSHISPVKHRFDRGLILGDGIESLKSKLEKAFPSTDFFSASILYKKPENRQSFLQMTEGFWPFKESSFDLIISAGTLHRLNDLPGSLLQARQCLKPDGLFIASFVGGRTLDKLRRTLYEVENQFYDRATARISPFVDPSMGTLLLQRAGFSIPLVTQDTKKVTFKNIFHLAHALRSLGENCVLKDAPPPVSRSFWQAVDQAFPRNNEDLIEDTFNILTLAGRAFHPDQQKKLKVSPHRLRLSF